MVTFSLHRTQVEFFGSYNKYLKFYVIATSYSNKALFPSIYFGRVYFCIYKHSHIFFLPSCWRSTLSTALLDVAISIGRKSSVFLALMSAPNSSNKFTISVLGCWAAAWSGVSQYLPLCTSAPVCEQTGMIKKQLLHE